MKTFALTVAAALFAATTAAAGPVFSPIFVESDGNRPDATGDIPSGDTLDIGVIAPEDAVGIAGRIVAATDVWEFTTENTWSISLVDLDLDDNLGFDSSDIVDPIGNFATNGDPTSAVFSIIDSDMNVVFTSASVIATDPGELDGVSFSGEAGSFFLTVSGAPRSIGATYDLGIRVASVPLPASVLLLLGGMGALTVAGRRKKA